MSFGYLFKSHSNHTAIGVATGHKAKLPLQMYKEILDMLTIPAFAFISDINTML